MIKPLASYLLAFVLLFSVFQAITMRIITDEPVHVEDLETADLMIIRLFAEREGKGPEIGCISQLMPNIYSARQYPAIEQVKSVVIEKAAAGLEIVLSDKSDPEKKATITIEKSIVHPIVVPHLTSYQLIDDAIKVHCSPNGCPRTIDTILLSTSPFIFMQAKPEL